MGQYPSQEMGMAVPGAVAAKLAHPNRRVVAVTGDGGFLMNSQELETAVRLKTPCVVLVFNDRSRGVMPPACSVQVMHQW